MNKEDPLPLRIAGLDELKSEIDDKRISGGPLLTKLDNCCRPGRWPEWFDLCRSAQQGGADHWLSLDDLLAPFKSVIPILHRFQEMQRYTHMTDTWWAWLHAGLRLAKLGRVQEDVFAEGIRITAEERAGVEEIANDLRLPEPSLRDLYAKYRGIPRLPVRECTIGLPLYKKSDNPEHEGTGVMGELRLALMPEGQGEIYPAYSLAFTYIKQDFLEAVAAGGQSLSSTSIAVTAERDIRWEVRLRKDGSILQTLEGKSCGGAFAMGLTAVAAGHGQRVLGSAMEAKGILPILLANLRPEELSSIAITATVNPGGQFGPIGKEVLKLQAAARDQWYPYTHTLVVADRQEGLDNPALNDPAAELQVITAKGVEEAIKKIDEDRRTRPYLEQLQGFDHRRWLAVAYPHLIGREWLRERLVAFLGSRESGYLLLTAGPGVGKTAFLFHQIDAVPKPNAWHFVRRGQQGWDSPEQVLNVLQAQLRLGYRLFTTLDPAKGPGEQFRVTLGFVAQKLRLAPEEKGCLILLDGLDEAFVPTGWNPSPVLSELLPRPPLPKGIYFVISSSPGEHLGWLMTSPEVQHLHLDPSNPDLWAEQQKDVAAYIASRAKDIRRELGLEISNEFQDRLLAASEGLFSNARRYLNADNPRELDKKLRAWIRDPVSLFNLVPLARPPVHSDVSPFACELQGPIAKLPLHLQTVWGLQRGAILGIIGGIRATDLSAQLSRIEADLASAVAETRLTHSIRPRAWGHLSLAGGDPVRSKDEIARACGESPAIAGALRSTTYDAPSPGLVLGVDSGSFSSHHDRCLSIIKVLTNTLHETESPALIIAIEDPNLAAMTGLIDRLGQIIENHQKVGGLDRLSAGALHLKKLSDFDEARIQKVLESHGPALGRVREDNESDLLDLIQSIWSQCPLVEVIDRLIRRFPACAEAFVGAAARCDNKPLQVATLHQIHIDDHLLDRFLKAYLGTRDWQLGPQDMLTRQHGALSTVDGAILGLMRMSVNNVTLRERATRALDELFDKTNPDGVLSRIRPLLDSTGLLHAEALSSALGLTKLAEAPYRSLWYLLRAGVSSGVLAEISAQLDLRRPQPWWPLFSRDWDRAELRQLLGLPAEKRAVFGLCSLDEWKGIPHRQFVIQCRRNRNLQWATRAKA
jgi:hypothetical protein